MATVTLSRTARRVEDWHARGLIDAATARVLLDDIGATGGGRSFASIAVWLGIVCLAFGSMTFVAANWDAMPRLLRMGALMGGVLVSYIVAGIFDKRGNPGAAEAFVLLGCGVFGAAVMFTGQMYHLPGPPSGGVFLWGLGSFVAALVTGSRAALGLAVILATLWSAMVMTIGEPDPFHLWFLPVWAVLAGAAWWMRARMVAHLCALGALVWLGLSVGIVIVEDEAPTAGYLALMGAFTAISLAILSATGIRALRGFEGAAVFYLMGFVFGSLAFLFLWAEMQTVTAVSPMIPAIGVPLAALALWPAFRRVERFDHILAAIWVVATVLVAYLIAQVVPYAVEAFALVVSIWAIRMGGRQGWAAVTASGYAAFAVTMLVIYADAAHGLLGTSLFYLVAGALLLIGALVAPRLLAVREGRT